MWNNYVCKGIVLNRMFGRSQHSKVTHGRKWIESPKKELRVQTRRRPALSKEEFKKKLQDCLTELKESVPKVPGLSVQDLSTDKNSCYHPVVKAMSERNASPWPEKLLDPRSADILSDMDLKREFLKQTAMCHEFSFKFEVPACGFSSYSAEEIDKYLLHKQSMLFILRKSAARSRDRIKKNSRRSLTLEEHEPESLGRPRRSDPVPTYNLGRKQIKLTEYRMATRLKDDFPLIIDLSFDSLMNERAKKSLGLQLDAIMNYNISHTTPFNVTLCNFNETSYLYSLMKKSGSFGFPNGLATVTHRSLVELDGLNLEDMIYLSPDAYANMEEFDATKSYIIGGLVDIGGNSSVKATYNTARRLGIKKVKFPLQKYLLWGNKAGRDELTLDVAFKILHTFRDTGCWLTAFLHIPKRFHRGLTEFGLSELNDREDLCDWYKSAIDRRKQMVHQNITSDSGSFLGWS